MAEDKRVIPDPETPETEEQTEEVLTEEMPEENTAQAPEDSSGEAPGTEEEAGPEESAEDGEEEIEEADEASEAEAEDSPDGEASEQAEADGKTGTAKGAPKQKTSFFGKRKKENEKLQQKIDELTDKLMRSRAEFDNYRKRTEREKSSMYIIGARDVVEKILPVVDNFERGLAQAPEDDSFADGMKMIYKQLMTTLEDLGVKPIEAVGQEFNPEYHNAVMHVDDDTVGENIVVEELQKGYTYKDFVVRHSMVKVAN